jgi:conjugal transfer ATP-binding protein TraC
VNLLNRLVKFFIPPPSKIPFAISNQKMLDDSLTERLPYWDLEQGIVFLRKGGMEFGIEIQVPSTLFCSDLELEGIWKAIKNVLRMGLPQGCRARLITECIGGSTSKVNEYVEYNQSENEVLNEMLRERAKLLEGIQAKGGSRQWRFFLLVNIPTQKITEKMAYSPLEMEKYHKAAKEIQSRIIQQFSIARFDSTAMDNQQVFELIFRYLNPQLSGAKLPKYRGGDDRQYAPAHVLKNDPSLHFNTLRRQVVACELDCSSEQRLKMGDTYISTISLLGHPEDTEIGMMDRLLHKLGQANFYLITDFTHEKDGVTMRNLKRSYRTVATPDKKGELPPDPSDAVSKRALENVVASMMEGGDHVFKVACTIILMGDDPKYLQYLKEIVVSEFSTLGGKMPLVGTVQNVLLYLEHLLPFGGGTNPYQRQLLERNGADFFCFSAPWRGSKSNPMMYFTNRWGNETVIDLFDPTALNHNGLIVGATRSGKSVMAQSMVASVLYKEGWVAIIDRGKSYVNLVEAVGGTNIIISPDISINPFDLPKGQYTPDDEQIMAVLGVLRTILPAPGGTREKIEDALILAAIEQSYAKNTSERSHPVTREKIVHFDTVYLSDFKKTLNKMEKVGSNTINPEQKQIARELAIQLETWTGDSLYGRFLDAPTSVTLDGDCICFELSGLKNYPQLEQITVLMISNMIWNKAKLERSRKKLLVFDEAWALFQVPKAKELIVSLYREGGKYGLFTYAIAQSVKDFLGFTGLVENASYFFIGRVKNDDAALADLLKLSERTIKELHTLDNANSNYREFLVYIDKGGYYEGGVVQNRTSLFEGWLFSSNPVHDAQRNRALEKQNGDIVAAIRQLVKEQEAA